FLVVEPPAGVKSNATMRTADVLAGDDFLTLNGTCTLTNYVMKPPVSTIVSSCPTPIPGGFFCSCSGGGGIKKANQSFSTDISSALSKMTADPEDFQNGCPNILGNQYLNWQDCRDQIGRFILGEPASGSNPAGYNPPASRVNNKFSDIYHATPLVVGPPNAFIRDDSYNAFKEAHNSQSPTGFRRPTVLYAATNDGLLHGFDTSVNAKENNEIFSVLIPAAVPKLPNIYPSGHAQILDGAPVARDVVFDRTAATQALSSNWHSVLVAGFGGGGRGYYAVEVTTPVDNPATPNVEVPKFLWQLTTTSSGGPTRELFGQNSATPAITTVFIADSFGVKHEVGVAILPGGYEEAAVPGSCVRDTRNLAGAQGKAAESEASALATSKTYRFRSKVPCWSGNSARGRSLSVVRIGTGEIIRTFLPTTHSTPGLEVAAPLGVTTIDTPIDSPLTGVPMVYPSQPGSVAQRVYVGDTDGAIWKFNISDPNPDNWTGGLFFDTVNTETVADIDLSYNAGNPIQLPPTMAFDRLGNVVLGIATGDQESFTSTGTNFVFSVTDYVRASLPSNLTSAVPNWHIKLLNGQRVSGPMAVFNSIMYFATFAPLAPGAQSCNAGTPRLWGRDFVKPEDITARDLGGAKRFNPTSVSPVPDYYEPPSADNKVIPGVTISITPTCADTSETASDEYVPNSTHYKMKKVFSGQTSLLAQVGGQDATGKLLKVEVALPSNANPTLIDSWASVLE
ncbi:MAG: hypothetical protein KBF88_13820, partial [Polyangiaceae bacterium]|nr:hypothetical protein [Polyangiaceae bacterium]